MTQRREKRYFSLEFKKEILGKIDRREATVAQLSSQHGLSTSVIYGWRRKLRENELDVAVDQAPRVERAGVDPRYVRHLEEKIREANERLGELYIVVEGLKKIQGAPGHTKNASSFIASGMSLAQLKRRAK